MNKKTKLFAIIESIIFLYFVFQDLLNINSSYIKYLGIVTCLIYNIINKNSMLSLAMIFTLISDYFLLLKEANITIGIITFIIVQIIYMYFLHINKCNNRYLIRLVIYLIILIICIIADLPILYILALSYFSTLIMNAICSLSNKKLVIMSIGFFLFIGCDICVGLHNILNYGFLYKIATMMMWIFYLPSQVLISIGGNKKC